MAFDEGLRDDLTRPASPGRAQVVEKRMFGGIGFMWQGNLVCGVMGDELLQSVSATAGRRFVRGEKDGARHPMTMGGRTSQGWILVPQQPTTVALLAKWVARAVRFVETLPSK